MVTAGHLGGYVVGGDEATYYPDLWQWLIAELSLRSMIDVGCGEGHALKTFRRLECAVRGIDGIPQSDPDIFVHDYTTGPYEPGWAFDLAWSCEFVEHVEEQYVPNFVATFQSARVVLLTHAAPGQGGHHHVNCRAADYWEGVMAAAGYWLDGELTDASRAVARRNPSPWNHYARAGLAFRRY